MRFAPILRHAAQNSTPYCPMPSNSSCTTETRRNCVSLQQRGNVFGDLLRSAEPSDPFVTAREQTVVRTDEFHPARLERGHVRRGGRVLPHLAVHGRRYNQPGIGV